MNVFLFSRIKVFVTPIAELHLWSASRIGMAESETLLLDLEAVVLLGVEELETRVL